MGRDLQVGLNKCREKREKGVERGAGHERGMRNRVYIAEQLALDGRESRARGEVEQGSEQGERLGEDGDVRCGDIWLDLENERRWKLVRDARLVSAA